MLKNQPVICGQEFLMLYILKFLKPQSCWLRLFKQKVISSTSTNVYIYSDILFANLEAFS